jgi:hypothetical protein
MTLCKGRTARCWWTVELGVRIACGPVAARWGVERSDRWGCAGTWAVSQPPPGSGPSVGRIAAQLRTGMAYGITPLS